jgi:non-ribosomal peptide synthetase component F
LSGSLLGPREALEAARFSMGVERPDYLSAPLVHEAFANIAAASPERQCLCYEGAWLSYGEVAQRVSLGAARLASLGVGPGVVVGVMLDRSFELVISILSVLKAGGCYLPCDPSYPDDRLQIYLEDGNAFLVLASLKHAERAKSMVGDGVPVVDITADSALDGAGTSAAGNTTLRQAGPEDPAYIIFTSGSTGRPKGVVIPHRGVRDLMPWLADMYKLSKYFLSLSYLCN